MNFMIIIIGKIINWISIFLNLGAGATWPGEMVLRINPKILQEFFPKLRKGAIIVAGTNGKTTTSLMIKKILEENGETVIHNGSGANLVNGIVSAFIQYASWSGSIEADYGVFEVDENSLPQVLQQISHSRERGNPEYEKTGTPIRSGMTKHLIIVLLNLFRDQLDRYGEVDVIAEKWKKSLKVISSQFTVHRKTQHITLIANADDPLIAYLGDKHTVYFGLEDTTRFQKISEHAMDSQLCPRCGTKLHFKGTFFSHLGHWSCPNCTLTRPKPTITTSSYPLPGLYNRYNTLSATAVAHVLKIPAGLTGFTPAFGRQEDVNGVKIFLSKNPAGFNESIRTAIELGAKNILIALNDRIPDGRDVSWIWDVDFEMLPKTSHLFVSGDRALDMAVRLKYSDLKTTVVTEIPDVPHLFILPTYSAMLEIRKKITGRKIL